ncbi:hypothetical protein FOZ60_011295 [Perkinsus olseni]|uniref:Uncharacterized protein n=1 Tax=Perkinsus olseni TaxID=32597 RepID=A0A7J6PB34_PEROL|nr:hypothetical protein FOZ60_011295 [Perkinsus olseni]
MRVFRTGLLTIPLHHQTLSSASKEHWASVTGKYNEEFGYYFVDYTSLRLTEKTMPDQGEYRTMRHHFSPFHNVEQYIQHNVHECEESMIEIARRMLAQNNTREVLRSAYPKLVAEFSKNPRAISPLIIARHARTHWAKGGTSAMRADCNQGDPNSAQPLSMLVMTWSEEHNHAFMNLLLLSDTRPSQHLEIPLSQQGVDLVRSAWRKHWASVTGKYDEEFGYYFVDHASVRLTEKTMPDQKVRKTMQHYFSPFHNMEQYTQKKVYGCEESMIEIARRMLAQNNTRKVLGSAYSKLVDEFSKNPRAISPLIISWHAWRHWTSSETYAMQAVCNQEAAAAPSNAHPLSMLVMIWSETHNHAFMNLLLLTDPRPSEHVEMPLSQQGLDLVRSTWRKVSHSQAERFNTSFAAMAIDVAKELLKNSSVKAMAEQHDWTIAMDDRDDEGVQVSFAEMLITAVLTGWNEELLPYVPVTPRRAMIRILRAQLSSLPQTSMAA